MVNQEPQKKWIKDYWICFPCAEERGGVAPLEVLNGKISTCKYCGAKNTTLVAYVEFDWPNDKALDAHSKIHRGEQN